MRFASSRKPKHRQPNSIFRRERDQSRRRKNYLTLTFHRRKAPAGVTYHLESSTELVTWSEDAAHVSISAPADDGNGISETLIARALPAIAPANTRQFLRCRVTLP